MTEPAQKPDGKVLTREQVSTAINTLVTKVSSQTSAKVVEDLYDLALQIDNLYVELGRLQPQGIKNGEIKTAHDELSAVIDATSEATFIIIGESEKLEKLGKALPPAEAEAVSASVTRIYEACGFQDITGQRIKKVVSTLQAIESKVDALIEALGGQRPGAGAPAADTRTGDAALLNGPGLPGQGISQDEIDKLLGF